MSRTWPDGAAYVSASVDVTRVAATGSEDYLNIRRALDILQCEHHHLRLLPHRPGIEGSRQLCELLWSAHGDLLVARMCMMSQTVPLVPSRVKAGDQPGGYPLPPKVMQV